jgi:alkylation response protein AidB-like acyl-CoA dehydrogenase
MDFCLSEEQIEFQEMVRKFARNEIAPLAAAIDEEERFPAESFAKMAELGLLGLIVPEEYGGIGQSILTFCVVMEEIAYACGATAMSYTVSSALCGHNLAVNASEAQKQRYLPDMCSGKKMFSIAMTEPGAGSDVLSMQTFAERRGDEYVINGSKTFITNAPVAEVFLVYVRTDRNAGPHGLSLIIVEKDTPGFSVGQPFKKMGMHGSPTAEIFFDDCRVPLENLVGEENKALGILLGGLDMERTVGAPMGIGGAQCALDKCLAYVKERQQFGQPLMMFEMILEKLANMSMGIEAARLLTHKAAWMCDQGIRCSAEASHAKLFATEMSMGVASEAVQIFGGYGYMREYDVERMFRDAKVGSIVAGTSEIQRLIIAREILKRSMG